MNIGLIIALVVVMLILVLGYNIMLQYKVKSDSVRKQESARYVAIIDATEELIGHAHNLPYSKDLLLCLNNRILDSLNNMLELDPKNRHLAQRVESVKQQVKQLEDGQVDSDVSKFKVPANDKQAIMMLKLAKRLRDTIRTEHNKGRFDTQAYVAENARLESIQMRINIENVIKRSNDAIARGQLGTAVQLLRKGIDALSTKNDPYSQQAKEKLQTMYDELEQKRIDRNAEELHQVEDKDRKDDMEALFGEKKKW